ncbi:S24 family peptidase [Pseudomonas monteilii]|uniref:S24 family peptidase n=1 Tax=Pseudomonas TaxID=286 RepID=UPI0009D7AD9E|nr:MULTISPECIES: S24 family peptidase [Pseudomonas]MBA6092853.1 S24 family peptidase [Pseudomonas monteilii]SMC57501.1 Phage repressor protein C, contains Cro/C1-type HTH and peptisase s24 domains [Pseudomonas sp. URIL14HWK12:I5]
MLTGPELGAAIEAARIAKGVSKKKIADDFQVKPPSVQGWVKNGRIDKSKLMDVIAYFADVVGPEHWGLRPGFTFESLSDADSEPSPDESVSTSAADIVRNMLAKQGKRLSETARAQLMAAAEASDEGNVVTVDFSRPGLVGDEVRIAHYDIRAAMGGGQLPHDYPEMLKDIRVSPSHLREIGVEFEQHYHLKVVTGWGQSMEPTIKHRDPLIVNINVRDFVGDGVYLFVWDDLLYIKRLQVADEDHYEMISDNPRHKDRLIRRDMTYIQARVLLVWNAHLV